MDGDGSLGIRNWGYYEPSIKGNLGLQLMSSVAERDAKPLLSARDPSCMISAHGPYFHRDCGVPEPQLPMDFVRESWIAQREKFLHVLPMSQSYAIPSVPSGSHHPLQITPLSEPVKVEHPHLVDNASGKRNGPLKKRSNGHSYKAPKVKKTKKVGIKDESNSAVPRVKPGNKSTVVVINGIDMDISGIPIPVCSCTGTPQQCYKWGIGGWQSACCTTGISMYPLPMSTKRRGARIAGRKMSQGAFKKVLEKLASEGQNFSSPIDLKTYWAKHGTNKFVTIR